MTWHAYQTSGLQVRSEVPLPMLPTGGTGAEVTIRRGAVPARLDAPRHRAPDHEAAPGVALLFQDVGRFLVEAGQQVTVEAKPEAEATALARRIVGLVMGVVLHQRGVLPLHASAVAHGGEAVLLLGRRGAGKSTLAAHCYRQGYEVLSDDYVAVVPQPGGGWRVQPGVPQLKLHADAMQTLGVSAPPLPVFGAGVVKYGHPVAPVREPAQLRRIVLLATGAELTLRPVSALTALKKLRRFTYRRGFLEGLGRLEAHFHQCLQLAEQVPMLRLRRPRTLALMPDTLRLIEPLFGEV